jgi:hypothetical protein
MRMTRLLKFLAVFTLASGSLLGFGIGSVGAATAAATTAVATTAAAKTAAIPGAGRLQLKHVQVRLSAAQRDRLARSGVTPANSSAFMIITEGGYCLDASTSSSDAGKNGDPVQLWTCTGGTNQYWYVGAGDVDGNNELVNDRWSGECLNVNDVGGERNGSPVQLWSCSVGTSNQYWNTHEWEICHENECNLPYLYNEGAPGLSTIVLDAVSQHIGDGDKVQVWQPNGGANQFWY